MLRTPRFQSLSIALATALTGGTLWAQEEAVSNPLGNFGSQFDQKFEEVTEAYDRIKNLHADKVNYLREEKKAYAKGNVRLEYEDIRLYANAAEIDLETNDVSLRGRVRIYRNEVVFQGEEAVYNILTKEVTATRLKSASAPLLFSAENLTTTLHPETPSKLDEATSETLEEPSDKPETPREKAASSIEKIESDSAIFTTHDAQFPNYRIEAKNMRIYPNDHVELRDVKIYAGNTPVLWLPFLSQHLDDELGFYLRPGFSSNWGAFLQTRYGVPLGDRYILQYLLDFRTKRGLAGGLTLLDTRFRENENIGRLQAWYANDLDPSISTSSRQRPDVNEDRHRFNIQQRFLFGGARTEDIESLYLDLDLNRLSDPFLYEDFFPAEYKLDPNPENLINLVKRHPRGTLSLLSRIPLNDFFRADSRLPEIALDATRHPLWNSGIFYEGETSAGIYSERLSSQEKDFIERGVGSFEDFFGVRAANLNPGELNTLLDQLRDQADGYSFKRFDTYHQLSFPKTYFNALSLTPRIGFRHTEYFDIDSGADDDLSSASRTLLHTGIEGAMKFSRVFPQVSSKRLGLDQLRHIVQPYFNYSYLTGDTLDPTVPRIDRLTPSTRLRPISIPQFTAIDDLAEWNVVRLGIRNVLQTKRDGKTHNWLQLNTYFDTFLQDSEFDREYSNIYNELGY
ncbi:MAG: hypothetical protein AAF514_17485 [Verrucomicrobiota bacterium]